MSDNFNTYIDNINPDVWRNICIENGILRHYSKGDKFASIGSICKYIGFVVSGTLKYVGYSDDGTEHVMGLIMNEGFVADWPFCLYARNARLDIVASSDCEIYCVEVKFIRKLIDSDSHFLEIVNHSTEAIFSTVYERYIDLYCKSPKQRYEDLLKQCPDLFNHFSLKDIASFLNISPTHLSRIRRG